MKRLSLIALVAAFVVSAFAFLASSAFAIPVFARKYNTQCNMCHTVPPRLNKFGVAFKENGFELPPGTVLPESEVYGNQVLSNDEPKAIVGAGLPFMVRTGLQLDLSTSANNVSNRFLGIVPPAVAFIGAGSVETPVAGLGFWIDTTVAGLTAAGAQAGSSFNAIDFDFNFNPLFKLSIGNDFAKVGYGLGLQPLYINTNADGNLAANIGNGAAPGGTGFTFGTAGVPGVEIRGTTNAATGLGLNYTVGYKTGLQAVKAAAGSQDQSVIYGHVSYFIDAINSNLGVGYAIENPAGVTPANAGKQLLVDFAYNVGENFLAIITYSSNTAAGAANLPSLNTISVQPEFMVSPELAIGGRYATSSLSTAGSPSGSILSVGVNYKLLQNVLSFVNYTSGSNVNSNVFTAGGANIVAGSNFSSVIAGLDFIF